MSGARLAAVVLAAGASRRLGTPKQLVPFRGEPLVRRAARAAIEVGASPVIVVLGAEAPLVAPALDGLAVEVVVNDAWESGLASSLSAGMRAALADPRVEGVIVTLADQPLVDAAALLRLVAGFPGAHGVVASTYRDALGVPAVFAREHAAALMGLTGDAGAGAWLRRRGDAVTRVPMDDAALDVDTAEDVARLAGWRAGSGLQPSDNSSRFG